jgi:hypothetical protein
MLEQQTPWVIVECPPIYPVCSILPSLVNEAVNDAIKQRALHTQFELSIIIKAHISQALQQTISYGSSGDQTELIASGRIQTGNLDWYHPEIIPCQSAGSLPRSMMR